MSSSLPHVGEPLVGFHCVDTPQRVPWQMGARWVAVLPHIASSSVGGHFWHMQH